MPENEANYGVHRMQMHPMGFIEVMVAPIQQATSASAMDNEA